MKYTDLVMLDLKEMNGRRHKDLTGWDNENILKMAEEMSEMGIPMWIRHVLVPGLTDDREGLACLRTFMDGLKTVEKFEILPYHTLGTLKWEEMGLEYSLDAILPPTEEENRTSRENFFQ